MSMKRALSGSASRVLTLSRSCLSTSSSISSSSSNNNSNSLRSYSTSTIDNHDTESITGATTPEGHLKYLRSEPGDYNSRAFSYFMLAGGKATGAIMGRAAALTVLYTLLQGRDQAALGNVEIDVSSITEGQTVTIMWRGKPVFVRHRTDADIDEARSVDVSSLRDPQPDEERSVDPKWSVLIAICTHLGCVPVSGAGAYGAGGYFCPCHGSHYDTAGRIRRGPAPLNLEIPDHKFLDGNTLYIGDLKAAPQ